MRDEIQVILPKNQNDMFSEELKIIINNIQVSQNVQRIELKVYNSESCELS